MHLRLMVSFHLENLCDEVEVLVSQVERKVEESKSGLVVKSGVGR